MIGAPAAIFSFGAFVLDVGRRELRRDGKPVKLQPKVFDMLAYLVENRDRALSKDELLDRLWPSETVTEWSLTFCIKSLRKVLGDAGASSPLVQTLHGRGYRFCAEVRAVSSLSVAGSPHRSTAEHPIESPAPPWRAWRSVVSDSGPAGFFGRDRELAALGDALDGALAGRPQLRFLCGEPGIGKSRLAGELAASAERRGVRVYAGRCLEEAPPILWPWVQIVRAFLSENAADTARALLGDAASDVARLIPTVSTLFPDLPMAPALEPEHARLRFLEGMTQFFRGAARREPLLLILDDLHWADATSLQLLRVLAMDLGNAPLLVLASYRDSEIGRDHPLGRLERRLRREGRCESVHLGGIEPEAAEALVRAVSAKSVPAARLTEAVRIAEGNPFFLVELGRHLATGEPLSSENARGITVPVAVRDVVLGRFQDLGEECRELLIPAAVIGREFDVGVLSRVVGRSAEEITDRLEQALDARLTEERGDLAGEYRFSHALVNDSIVSALSHTRRARLHREIGEALEAEAGAGRRIDPGALAYHFERAVTVGDTVALEKAIDYSLRAAEWAVARFAFDEAPRQHRRALSLMAAIPGDSRARRCGVLLDLGHCLAAAGDGEAASAAFRDALDLARSLGRADWFAQAAVGMVGEGLTQKEESARAVEEALALLGPEDSEERARALARLAVVRQLLGGERGECEAWADAAVAMARRLGDPAALFRVLGDWRHVCWLRDRLETRL